MYDAVIGAHIGYYSLHILTGLIQQPRQPTLRLQSRRKHFILLLEDVLIVSRALLVSNLAIMLSD